MTHFFLAFHNAEKGESKGRSGIYSEFSLKMNTIYDGVVIMVLISSPPVGEGESEGE